MSATSQPRVRDTVVAACSKCGEHRQLIYRELIRSVNVQLQYVDAYACPVCLYDSPRYKELSQSRSIKAKPKITKGASERSKRLWQDSEYRSKCLETHRERTTNAEFKAKISKTVKEKFKTDSEYVARVVESRRLTKEEIIRRFVGAHGDKYGYDLVDYRGIDTHVVIICHIHGQFKQTAKHHLNGHGCPSCGLLKSQTNSDDFIQRCKDVHGDSYDYSNTKYVGVHDDIEYVCGKHGNVIQLAQNHVRGSGCRYCDSEKTSSIGESELADYVTSATSFDVVRNRRDVLPPYEVDIAIPKLKLAIEYHGLYWHSYNHVESRDQKYKHHAKADAAARIGWKLLQIYESEWLQSQSIVKSIITGRLGRSNKVGARKCNVVRLSNSEALTFFNDSHLQGHRTAKMCLGLIYNDMIVAAASFSKTSLVGRWELIRFCNSLNCVVVGGLSKLLKHAHQMLQWNELFTYADRRLSVDAQSYLKVGFESIGITEPGYTYVKGLHVFSRQKFQKHKLSEVLPDFDATLTESSNMFNNGYRRLWDAGHHRLLRV